MVVDILLNTRFLLLDNEVIRSVNFLEVSIIKDANFRDGIFYDKTGLEELGTYTAMSPFQKYAYGYTAHNLEYITNATSREEVIIELGHHLFIVQGYFNNLLFMLWFIRDNSVSADFAYIRSNPVANPSVNAISYNHITMFTSACEQKEEIFSEMELNFKTIAEFNDYFKDEKTCYEYLESKVWGGVPVCPHCATAKKPYTVKARGKFTDIPSYRCSERACGLPFTVRTGSIFEGSKVELRKWLQASYELSISKKGISSVELASRIGVSQKTAWFINHRLRAMLTETNPELLTGIIEADETFVGGKESNKHYSKKNGGKGKSASKVSARGTVGKTMVLGLLQRDGKVRTFVVADRGANTLQSIMRNNVETNSRLITDALPSYVSLKDQYTHESIKHTLGDYRTTGDKHTNNIEGYWSILKRGIIGTFHSVSPQHLQGYCDEFAHRYNSRTLAPIERFDESIKQAFNKRVTYKILTAKKATC